MNPDKYIDTIHGKNHIENITQIETYNDKAILFIERDGKITTKEVSNAYWLLATEPLNDRTWTRLKGNLYYKYGTQYKDFVQFIKVKKDFKHQGYDTYNINNTQEALMVKDGYTLFKDMNLSDVSVLSFDFETTTLKPSDLDAKILLISNTFRNQGKIISKLFCYDEYKTQGEMLQAWCNWILECNPTVILGYNIVGFDLPYAQYIAKLENVELTLGRDHSPLHFERFERKFRVDGNRDLKYNRVTCYGRHIIDGMFLSLKYDFKRNYENYQLKYIIKYEKLEDVNRQHYDASKIRDNYKNPVEWIKIKNYCIGDSNDALKLYDLMAGQYFTLCQYVPRTFQSIIESASGGQINSMMVRAYLQEGHSIPKADYIEQFPGGLSHGVRGIYNNCVSFDIASLYPSVMIAYNIFDKIKDPNNYLNLILKYLRNERFKNKKLGKDNKYYYNLEQSQKIILNSMFGFYSTSGLNFNYPEGAREVTRRGRETLKTAIKWATGKLHA